MRSIAVVCFSVFVVVLALGCGARDLPEAQRRLLSGDSSFNYLEAGEDWVYDFPDCAGQEQSPINVVTDDVEVALSEVTARFSTFGTGRNVKVMNEGQAIKVEWEQYEEPVVQLPVSGGEVAGAIDPFASITSEVQTSVTRSVRTGSGTQTDTRLPSVQITTSQPQFSFARVQPIQFHFHISSENAVDGMLAPMEAHLVSIVPKSEVPECGDDGCVVVFATLFKVDDQDKDNAFLEDVLEAVPTQAGKEHAEKFPADFEIKLDDLMPEEKSYYTWAGSFTTPPCTEGVTWIMFENFMTMSSKQLSEVQRKMGSVRTTCQEEAESANNFEEFLKCNYIGDLKNNRAVQPLHGRVVKYVPNAKLRSSS